MVRTFWNKGKQKFFTNSGDGKLWGYYFDNDKFLQVKKDKNGNQVFEDLYKQIQQSKGLFDINRIVSKFSSSNVDPKDLGISEVAKSKKSSVDEFDVDYDTPDIASLLNSYEKMKSSKFFQNEKGEYVGDTIAKNRVKEYAKNYVEEQKLASQQKQVQINQDKINHEKISQDSLIVKQLEEALKKLKGEN